jgi:pimeloyl-ACP methyl ester carboxylesterase
VDAPPLLLLHGGLGDAALHWHHNFADLSRDFRLLAPDLPAFGRTAALPAPSYPAYRAWVGAFCTAVGVPGDLTVVGNSMGAALARLFAAVASERVRGLVLVDGGMPLAGNGVLRLIAHLPPLRALLVVAIAALATSDRAMGRYVADPARLTPPLKANIRRGVRTYLRVQSRMLAVLPVSPAELQPICPVLVVWGAQDGLGPPRLGSELAQAIGAQAVAVIDGAGHMPMFEQPAEFSRVLRRFTSGQ